jgi:hypothetical protein
MTSRRSNVDLDRVNPTGDANSSNACANACSDDARRRASRAIPVTRLSSAGPNPELGRALAIPLRTVSHSTPRVRVSSERSTAW